MASFADLIAVTERPAGPDGTVDYIANIDPTWTVGPKVHGGAMLALCASAAAAAYRAGDGASPTALPAVVAADFLSAPDPGEVVLRTRVVKRGRTTSAVDVELFQGDGTRASVRASVTLAEPEDGEPRYDDGSSSFLPPEPAEDAIAVEGDNPMAQIFHVSGAADVRYDASATQFLRGEKGAAETRGWVRLRESGGSGGLSDALFALLCGDISVPVVANLSMYGWAPTLQLTGTVRRVPAPGWLRFRASSAVVGQRWFEEDHLIVDAAGHVVASTRQLAMLPKD
ncbi:thioesterase family protein [Tsukamurella sp. 8F]|uniref:thioesterase family protein n=1 Tax=unclassified Tsukamurella TaxID=2633480 RepID=UPI0023B8DD11|nr:MULTISPECIES: thioesterase family protein [unclassified Tsukamurella]MDF0531708.1 thioesterase family protein [Tsukamurella sp. 8J]MDF0588954.1 thioesterase family protein [Tsukamurella sp. 8F]